MGSDCTERSAQGLAADRADVVVHPDACQAIQDLIGGTLKTRAPLTPCRRQTFRLQLQIVTRCERFNARDHQPTAVLAGPFNRYLFGVEHHCTVVEHGSGDCYSPRSRPRTSAGSSAPVAADEGVASKVEPQGHPARLRGMMAVMPARRSIRLLSFVAAVVVLVAVAVVFYAIRDPRGEVIDESAARSGWKTLQYEGVTVDIPSKWVRLDMGDCEFRFERWAPPGVRPCAPDAEGVAFYGSATFDTDLGPGVIKDDGEDPQAPDWEGYVQVGDFAVYASGGDRAIVESILDSAK